ncbi:MAG: aspartate carbamoyltransferase regulatory subunit [Clostridia bacterium]|nr:aspartate carbamoyltransferase regulatory subunit [Clostridia bacterium]
MRIDEITNGIVIDHIKAGKGMQIYHFLKLGELDCPVAIIKNVNSHRMGKKDLIKVDTPMDIDLDVLGYIDAGITVNIIKDGKRVNKLNPTLPEKLVNVIKCKNPRCITTTEQEIDQIFKLTDKEKKVYRCAYCETKYSSD